MGGVQAYGFLGAGFNNFPSRMQNMREKHPDIGVPTETRTTSILPSGSRLESSVCSFLAVR